MMVCLHPYSLGWIIDRQRVPFTEEALALANMRGAHVLRTATCPECEGPLVTGRGTSDPVRDTDWFTYRCASKECLANGSGWMYRFVPGALKRLASGTPLSIVAPKVRWRDGRSEWDIARARMLETEECPLCGTDLVVRDGSCPPATASTPLAWYPDVSPTSYACPAPGCGMEWLVHPQAVRAHIRELGNQLRHVQLAAKALSDEHDMVVQVHKRRDRDLPDPSTEATEAP